MLLELASGLITPKPVQWDSLLLETASLRFDNSVVSERCWKAVR
jgi:hypothetical protein